MYDPTWANAREFLNLLQSNGLMREILDQQNLGNSFYYKAPFQFMIRFSRENVEFEIRKKNDESITSTNSELRANRKRNNPQVKQMLVSAHRAKSQAEQDLSSFQNWPPTFLIQFRQSSETARTTKSGARLARDRPKHDQQF